MADQVDSMSDAELRTKLAEHGFPIMPVTASTRKLLVKKLKLVLDNKSKPRNNTDNVEGRRTLARYSSGEESDLDTTNNFKEKRGRRQTTGGSMLPPTSNKSRRADIPKKGSPVKHDSDKESESEDEKPPVRTHEEVETITTRRVTHHYATKDQDECETGSDSDVDIQRKTSSPLRSNSTSSDYISSTLPTSDIGTSPPKFSSSPSASPGFASSLSSEDHLNSIRSRLGLTSSFGNRPSLLGDRRSLLGDRASSNTYSGTVSSAYQPSTSKVHEHESPYLSNFTRRLTSLKTELKPTPHIDRDGGGNNERYGSALQPRRSYITRSEDLDYKVVNDRKFLRNNIVSLALVALVALFFFFLFFMYIVKRNDITSVVDDQNSVIPICQLNIPGNRPGINCVPKEQLSYAKDLMKLIHPELTSRTAAYKCGQANTFPYMTEKEILDKACSSHSLYPSVSNMAIDISQCRSDLNNLEVLLLNNPRWGLNVVQMKNLYTKDIEFSTITTIDEMVRNRAKGAVAIALADPSTPVSCLFLNTVYSAASTLIIIAILSVLIFFIQKFYKYYVAYKKKRNDEIYSMVEQIIDTISQETLDSGEPYISIDHIRDTLISPQNREKMSPIWDAAVKFIESKESRVRREVQSVDGEDCKVWRWIGSSNSPKHSASWQGQAFETQEGSVNNLTVSPTPCLKIRNMFDKNNVNPNLRTVIQDVILEKCGDRCNILHIDIERTSCCVYVKCSTPDDAGVVYRNLHGWWYEGRLITVKYLRLERYMQRFPNSPSSGTYLKPSRQSRAWEG